MGRRFPKRFAAFPIRPLGRLLRHFAHARQGATAVEFALIAGPFVATLMIIFEVAYLFLLGEALDNGLSNAARQILTGCAQQSTCPNNGTNKITDQASFRNYALCPSLPSFLDCNNVQTNVAQASSFTAANPGAPINQSNGTLDTSTWGYTPCQTGSQAIMKVEAVYPVGALSAFFTSTSTVTIAGAKMRVLYVSSVFRCEPF